MTTETKQRYIVTITRPSRSKCPNAWAKRDGVDGWLPDTFTAEHGEIIILGGNIRRATRTEKVVERPRIDMCGEWTAFGGAGCLKIQEA